MTTHSFQAEVGKVLSLVINSLYSNKEIFLRELISNASDALDKLRFRAITEPGLLAENGELVIRLRPDAERGVLVIEDTGIGMGEQELIENLGTVARSGSQAFLAKLEESARKDVSIIGQFGVGFYSTYLVADRVVVTSRAAGSEQAFRWTSDGKDTFTTEQADRAARGTSIELHLKEDQKDLLDPWKLRDLVRRYSDYIAYPIELETKEETPAKDDQPAKTEDKREQINKAAALWQRSKSEITDEQYNELYNHLTHDYEPAVARTHFRVEGNVEFVGLFFVPKEAPFDLDDPRKQRGVRLFVKRVLVMEDCEAVLPQWLRFVRGLIDSDDLPLNVSRELLQESAMLRTIKKQVTKRVLDLLDDQTLLQNGVETCLNVLVVRLFFFFFLRFLTGSLGHRLGSAGRHVFFDSYVDLDDSDGVTVVQAQGVVGNQVVVIGQLVEVSLDELVGCLDFVNVFCHVRGVRSFGRELAGSIDGPVVRSIAMSRTATPRMRVPLHSARAWGSCQEWAATWCIRRTAVPARSRSARHPRLLEVWGCRATCLCARPALHGWTRRAGPRDLWRHSPATSGSRRRPRGCVFYSTPWTFLRLSQHPPPEPATFGRNRR